MTSASITTTMVEPAEVEQAGPVRFDAPRGALIWMLIKITALSIVTLGFYRFWGKTRLRRFFWHHVSIAGDRLEYTGRASELLIGFLIALVFLVPVLVIPPLFELLIADPILSSLVSGAQTPLLLILIQAAIYRARRYRLSRTVWRGIRFGQDGSALRYAANSFIYWALVALTLGFGYPWARTGLTRYEVTHTWFGGTRFGFDAQARRLFTAWLPVLVSGLVTFGLLGAALGPLAGQDTADGGVQPNFGLLAAAVLLAMVTFILFVRYRVREFRYFTESTALDVVRFESALRLGRVVRIALLYVVFLVVAVLVISAVIIGIAIALGLATSTWKVLLPFLPLLLIFSGLGAMAVLNVAWLRFELVKAVAASLSIRNLDAVERIVQNKEATPRHGEGLADALDVGGF